MITDIKKELKKKFISTNNENNLDEEIKSSLSEYNFTEEKEEDGEISFASKKIINRTKETSIGVFLNKFKISKEKMNKVNNSLYLCFRVTFTVFSVIFTFLSSELV